MEARRQCPFCRIDYLNTFSTHSNSAATTGTAYRKILLAVPPIHPSNLTPPPQPTTTQATAAHWKAAGPEDASAAVADLSPGTTGTKAEMRLGKRGDMQLQGKAEQGKAEQGWSEFPQCPCRMYMCRGLLHPVSCNRWCLQQALVPAACQTLKGVMTS